MTQQRGLCHSCLSGCGFKAVLGWWALQSGSDSWPVCSSPFPEVCVGLSPAPGWYAARAGSREISPQAGQSCGISPQICACVSFHCLALPGPGPVYQSCNPNPVPLSQLSPALIRKKLNTASKPYAYKKRGESLIKEQKLPEN